MKNLTERDALMVEIDQLKSQLLWAEVECGSNHGNGACLRRERTGKCNCTAGEQLRELLEAAEVVRARFGDSVESDILFAELDVAIAKVKVRPSSL